MEQTDLFSLVDKLVEGQRGHKPKPKRKPNRLTSLATRRESQPTTGVIPDFGASLVREDTPTTVSFPRLTAPWKVQSVCEFARAKITEIELIARQPLSDWLKGECIGSSLAACNEAVEHLGQEINRLRKQTELQEIS